MQQRPQPAARGSDRGVSQQLHARVELDECPATVLPDHLQQRPGHDRGAPADLAMPGGDANRAVDGRLHLGALIQQGVIHHLQDKRHPATRFSRSRTASAAQQRPAATAPAGSALLIDQAAICRLTVAAVANAPAASAA